MADQKKNQMITDDQKASSIAPDTTASSVSDTKKKIRKAPKVKKPKKKGMPLVLDILIVLVLLAAIAAAVYGIYWLGNRYATRYVELDISYTMLAEDVDPRLALDQEGQCVIVPKSDVYLADGTGSYPLGQVVSASVELDQNGMADIYVTVRATADYNRTLGYFVEQTKIAVGKAYSCRFSGLMSDVVITELQLEEKES